MMSQGMISSSLGGQMVPICVYIVMAVSLNLTVGILGELSLGHAGFMSVGAFSGVVAAISLQSVIPNGALRLIAAVIIAGAGYRCRRNIDRYSGTSSQRRLSGYRNAGFR